MSTVNPIFILGVPRSGTTLLRVLLDSHSEILGAPETSWITGGYGDFSLRKMVESVSNDKLGAVGNLRGVDDALIYESAQNFMSPILKGYLKEGGKKVLILKTPDDIRYLDFLGKLFPESKYIHIYRDGRDVACSTYNQKGKYFGDSVLQEFGELTQINSLRRWVDWESRADNFLMKKENKAIHCSYEDLITKPDTVLRKLCKFLNVKYEKSMIDYSAFEHAYPDWEAGSNDVKARYQIEKTSLNRWKNEIDYSLWREVDLIAGKTLERLGYTLCSDLYLEEEPNILHEIERIKKIVDNQKDYIHRLKHEKQNIKNINNFTEVLSLKAELETQKELVARYDAESSNAEQRENKLRQEVTEMEGLIKAAAKKEEELKAKVREYIEDIKYAKNREDNLLEKIESSKEQSRTDISFLKKEIELLRSSQVEDRFKIVDFESKERLHALEVQSRESALQLYLEKVSLLQSELLNLSELNVDLKRKYTHIENQKKAEKVRYEELVADIDKNYREEKSRLAVEIKSIKGLLSNAEEQKSKIESVYLKIFSDLEKAKQENNRLKKDAEKASQIYLAKNKNWSNEKSRMDAKNNQKEKVITNLYQQLSVLKEQVRRVEENKHREIKRVFESPTFRVGKIITAPARYVKRLVNRPKRHMVVMPVDHVGETIIKDSIDLGDQITGFFGNHRSGWSYAVSSLALAHNPKGIYLDTFVERSFVWSPDGVKPHKKPWVGFIHVPPQVPEWFQYDQSNEELFKTNAWQESLPFCKGLFTLSEYHKKDLQKKLNVPIEALIHPTEIPETIWSWDRFIANNNKKIIQLGWWLRKLHAIYQLPKPKNYAKVFLKVTEQDYLSELMATEKEMLLLSGDFTEDMYLSATLVSYLPDHEYDIWLSENIGFMNLYDASANNAVIECIARGTPLLVNRLPPVVEYLGEDYPLYYSSYDDAIAKAEDFDLINQAHHHLMSNPIREKLSGKYFLESVMSSRLINRENST